jgi:hypothetical protein
MKSLDFGKVLLVFFCVCGSLWSATPGPVDNRLPEPVGPRVVQVHPEPAAELNVQALQPGLAPPDDDNEAGLAERLQTSIKNRSETAIPFFMPGVEGRNVFGFCFGLTTLAVPKVAAGIYLGWNFPGALAFLSGVADFAMSDYSLAGVKHLLTDFNKTFAGLWRGSRTSFKEMVLDAYNSRDPERGTITEDRLDHFVDFALGEYKDLYSKRGLFNKEKFKESLVRY